jgi:DNA topoisomerase VI subunit B
MSIDLNVLNHLGIRLYSNVPAVVSEAVANAWDADASEVSISLHVTSGEIVIEDDGIGMTEQDVNDKFLKIGYRRREGGFARSPQGRAVMGRKGIGKLSLFSIAREIEIHSAKDGEVSGLVMRLADIEEAIKAGSTTYRPQAVKATYASGHRGTKITLRHLRKAIDHSEGPLRRRLARRFAVIGEEQGFPRVREWQEDWCRGAGVHSKGSIRLDLRRARAKGKTTGD